MVRRKEPPLLHVRMEASGELEFQSFSYGRCAVPYMHHRLGCKVTVFHIRNLLGDLAGSKSDVLLSKISEWLPALLDSNDPIKYYYQPRFLSPKHISATPRHVQLKTHSYSENFGLCVRTA